MNTTRLTRAVDGIRTGMREIWAGFFPAASHLAGEQGDRLDSERAMNRLYATMWLDTERRAIIRTMREMDQKDPRIKKIHSKVAQDCTRGGLVLQVTERSSSATLKAEWEKFKGRVQLDNVEKLKSDARGFGMEGNLPLQLVLNDQQEVLAALRMPSDTIIPMTDGGGRFKDPAHAYEQRDVMTGRTIAAWPAWQMPLVRLDPDNFDDLGSMGRPLLDAMATTWRKLTMTEEDLVIRRRTRAPLRLAHVLEGASDDDLKVYRKQVESDKAMITTDFYMSKRGSVSAVQGDAKLSEIEDVLHLLDTFYAGSPAPKALFGYTEGLNRDILEDLKRDYFETIDALQETLAAGYSLAFRMHLLFKGIDPATDEFTLRFAERRTETPNQIADLALKYIGLGMPDDLVFAEMGYDPDFVRAKRIEQARRNDPYPNASNRLPQAQRVSITPGNAPKGESATSVSTPGSNGGRGRA